MLVGGFTYRLPYPMNQLCSECLVPARNWLRSFNVERAVRELWSPELSRVLYDLIPTFPMEMARMVADYICYLPSAEPVSAFVVLQSVE